MTGCPLTGFFLEAGRRDLQEKLALLKEGTVGDILAEAALSSPGEGVRWIRGRIDRTGAFAEGIEYLGGSRIYPICGSPGKRRRDFSGKQRTQAGN